MKAFLLGKMIPALLAVLGTVVLWSWLTAARATNLTVRVQNPENAISQPVAQALSIKEAGKLTTGDGAPADVPGSWPCFRGAGLDNIATDPTPLARKWPEGGPRRLWAVALGEGYAGPAVRDGRVYILDYDQTDKHEGDAYRCLSLADGKEIWRFWYPLKVKRQHGMSRTVVAVTEDAVVGLGPFCQVTCLDAKTGELRWDIDLVRDFGAMVPQWYAGQCPLVDGERSSSSTRVILAPGGKALMIAVEVKTGKVIWKTPNPEGWEMTHSSIVPMEFGGRRTYVYCASGGVIGVAADDGKLLWTYPKWRIQTANVPSPVPVGDGRIFLSGGYNAGSQMIRLKSEGGKLAVDPLFELKAKDFGAEQQTPILYQGHLYGVRPNGELVCLDLDGQILWTSGREHHFGLGAFMLAGGMLYVLNDEGVLTLAEATPEGYRQLDQAKVLEGHESWGPMALVAGRLLVRDLTRMVCLDVSQGGVK